MYLEGLLSLQFIHYVEKKKNLATQTDNVGYILQYII